MKKACLIVNGYLAGNRVFNANLHRDNAADRFVKLKDFFSTVGFDLSTHDVNHPDESKFIIYSDNMPKVLPNIRDRHKSYIILSESEFIMPENFDTAKHSSFRRVFTWHDQLVDNDRYVKVNFAHAFPQRIEKTDVREGLCVLIAGNKKASPDLSKEILDLDLYKERERTIRWFEKYHPNGLDLYGVGWDRYCFAGPKIIRALNRVPSLSRMYQSITGQKYSSYRGPVKDKISVMKNYKYSICYENARDIPGYITEKIFDSFFAGCVPIYWGANNIADHIPPKCYIDRRDFRNHRELYCYLTGMSKLELRDYQDSIENFLRSEAARSFQSEGFADTIVSTIIRDLHQ